MHRSIQIEDFAAYNLHGPWAREPNRNCCSTLLHTFQKKMEHQFPHSFYSDRKLYCIQLNYLHGPWAREPARIVFCPPPYFPKWKSLLQAIYMGFGHTKNSKLLQTNTAWHFLSCKVMRVVIACSEISFLKPLFCPVG